MISKYMQGHAIKLELKSNKFLWFMLVTLQFLFICMRRLWNFCQRGPGPTARKQPGQRCFFSPQLILLFTEGGPMVLLQRKLYFPKDPEGSNISSGRGPTFSRRGSKFKMLISI